MLISGFFFLFVACIMYMHADLSISKSSPSYLAKLQWDEVCEILIYKKYVPPYIFIYIPCHNFRCKQRFSRSEISSTDA